MKSSTGLAVLLFAAGVVDAAGCAACGADETTTSPLATTGHDVGTGGERGSSAGGSGGSTVIDASAGGNATGDATVDADADSGHGEGCTEFSFTSVVIDGDEYFYNPGIAGGVWSTEAGIHIAWMGAAKVSEDAGPGWGDGWHVFLIVSSFDPATGKAITHRRYDLLPPEAQPDLSFHAASSGPGGAFAAAYDWTDGQTPSGGWLMIGQLDNPGLVTTVQITAADYSSPATEAVTWDGEAFAVNGRSGSNPAPLSVARVDVTGKLLLAFTRYGEVGGVGYDDTGFKVATDPTSGTTYVFGAADIRLLAGHLRDGTPLPGTSIDKPKVLDEALPFDFQIGNIAPWISAASGEEWLLWSHGVDSDYGWEVRLQRLGPLGEALTDPMVLGPRWPTAVLARGGGRAWAAFETPDWLYQVEVDKNKVGPTVPLLDDAVDWPKELGLDIRDSSALVDAQGSTWLAFTEMNYETPVTLRVVRVKEGCVYQSLRKRLGPFPKDGG